MGIGMALMERTDWDQARGAPATRNLADYLVPVNADIPDITVDSRTTRPTSSIPSA